MAAVTTWARPSALPRAQREDQSMIVNGVSWKDYVILREALDTPGLRMTYCEGVLELMSPSPSHERWKKAIARLIEHYALVRGIPINGYGSTTFRQQAKERGVEPDECYLVGSILRDGVFPDIVLEVIYGSPILDKLHVYDGFDVPEVWLFKDEAFELYRRRDGGGYDRVERSRFFPELDFAFLARFVTREDQHAAVLEFADAIR